MKTNKKKMKEPAKTRQLALDYMATLVEIVDVARESFLILDSKLKIIAANPTFYKAFRVAPRQTVGKFVYRLGNGQWNIPLLKRLLKEILPKKKVVKNYEITHVFQSIGEKSMLLNARQIDSAQLIILAIEDITPRKTLEKKLVEYTKKLESRVAKRTEELTDRVKELESLNKTMVGRELRMVELKREIDQIKKSIKNGTGRNDNGHNKTDRQK